MTCVFERGRLKTKQKQMTTSGRENHEARTEKDQGSVRGRRQVRGLRRDHQAAQREGRRHRRRRFEDEERKEGRFVLLFRA